MDVFEAIKSRRSHRAFAARAVEPEKIDAIIQAGCWAPSPANIQPWEFLIITGQASRDRLLELSEESRRNGRVSLHGYSYIRTAPVQSVDDVEAALDESLRAYSFGFIRKVPLIVAVIGQPMTHIRAASQTGAEDAYKYACAAAIQNMLLAAHSLGLGSLWFTLFDEALVSGFLNIGPGKKLVALVCIGYPSGQPANPGRYPFESQVRFFDR